MGRPRIHAITREALQAAAARHLTAPQFAAEVGMAPSSIYMLAKAAGVRLVPSRAPPLDPKQFAARVRRGGVVHCLDCPQMMPLPAPVRCSACVARRSLALIALARELGREGGYGRRAG
jgi:hypothetical protein